MNWMFHTAQKTNSRVEYFIFFQVFFQIAVIDALTTETGTVQGTSENHTQTGRNAPLLTQIVDEEDTSGLGVR